MNQNTDINLSVYPNPSKGNLFINTYQEIISISIYNIVGKEVTSGTRANKKQLDLNLFNNGVYFINISTDQGVITKKIILSR